MKLWLLDLAGKHCGYDTAHGFVIRAVDDNDARIFASSQSGDEGHQVWLNPEDSTCVELLPEGEQEVVLRDFCNG